MNTSIVHPMAAMVGFTFLFSLFMLWTRVQAVRKGQMKVTYFKTFNEGEPSREVLAATRHYSNLFELPVIFYATCVLILAMGLESKFSVFWAWIFVFARIAHAVIHVGPNKLYPRMTAFFVGWIAILAMWTQILRFL